MSQLKWEIVQAIAGIGVYIFQNRKLANPGRNRCDVRAIETQTPQGILHLSQVRGQHPNMLQLSDTKAQFIRPQVKRILPSGYQAINVSLYFDSCRTAFYIHQPLVQTFFPSAIL